MQTKRLYDEDPYLREFEAMVLSCEPCSEGFSVILDRTAFFPEQGGQYADKGIIGTVIVLDVRIKNDIITHITDKAIDPGTAVACSLDWELRFSNMQNHSGEHLVSGFVNSTWGYDNVGFHLGYDEVTLDFNGTLEADDITLIENTVNKAIYENIETVIIYPSKEELASINYRSKKELEGQVRIVSFPGYDICACCAPHVRRTGEIGMIKITNFFRFKKGTRICILCGYRALNDFRKKQAMCENESRLLSSKINEVDLSVEKLKAEHDRLKYELQALSADRLKGRVSNLLATIDKQGSANILTLPSGKLIYLVDDISNDTAVVRNAVNSMLDESSEFYGIFSPSADNSCCNYIIGSRQGDCKNLLSELKQISPVFLGGGSKGMIQGTVRLASRELEDMLKFYK